MWILLRFKEMGATRQQLLTIWQQKGRSILEFASPVFFSRLTIEQSEQIENCQRKAFTIILSTEYRSYNVSLVTLGQERLSTRRVSAALRFGQKCVNNPKHADMFPLNELSCNVFLRDNLMTRNKLYKEYYCNTNRLYNSSLPAITRLLNQDNSTQPT